MLLSCLLSSYEHVGYQHEISGTRCQCEPKAITLLRYGLRPATPVEPTMAFTQELMEHIQDLVMECQVSVFKITNVLDLKSSLHSKVSLNRINQHNLTF